MRFLTMAMACAAALSASAVNPILPLWEHIPDGEPYIFDDPDAPGQKRVYLYGSHDMLKTKYCGTDLVVWSAPVDSLDKWRYDGIIFESIYDSEGNPLNDNGEPDILYAPDVTEFALPDGSKRYLLIPNNQSKPRNSMVAVSERPDGPFKVSNWDENDPKATVGLWGFDPAILIDDDGRVYGYWGFTKSYGAELDPSTMATLKPGTEIVENMVGNEDTDNDFRFFEASSIRKIEDKYVFIYSRWSKNGEWGLHRSNYTLAYAYSDNPLGPFTYGGTIIDARGRDTDADGKAICTATPFGNTHGSIAEINGQWWVFYHRQTGADEFARQAMVAPIEVKVTPGPGGKVEISEAEYTSEGFETYGLDPFKTYPAGIASHYTGPSTVRQKYPVYYYSGSYIKPEYVDDHNVENPYGLDININPVVNNVSGSVVGYKYFNFDHLQGKKDVELELNVVPEGVAGKIYVYAQAPWKGNPQAIGEFDLPLGMEANSVWISAPLHSISELKGKHPLYLVFESPEEGKSICMLNCLRFK
ncbi:MAG: family 43 glycosylhydrolase [Lachnospiraceae bacterium]|nr:family 43 glycosylhydrolase [Lachnospiraceae bacterium]